MLKACKLTLTISFLMLATAFIPLYGSGAAPDAAGLESGFATPAAQARPWAYWWWVNGNVDEATITRDLEQMKAKGFAGLLMFDARGYHNEHLPPPPEKMAFMSPEWRRLVRFALGEADRLGLKVSINLSSCAGALRGPWDVGEDAPKQLVWAIREIPGGKRFEGEPPSGNWTHAHDVALLAARRDGTGDSVRLTEVVDLTDKVRQGRLAWDVPPGNWILLRFASLIMAGHEKDVDILDTGAVERYFDRMGGALLADAGPLAGKTLTHFYSVSWEGAIPTWTQDFEADFQRYRGYTLRPWLPVLAGMTVQSRELSERLRRDYHKTLSECFMNHCYGTLGDLCHKHGLQWHSESGGPWDRKLPSFEHADQLAFYGRNDMPQGEFWLPWRGFTRPVAMAAHLYGRPLAAAEAFTNMQPHWADYPALLKPLADSAFCDGINQLIWHTFTASPAEFGKPGIEYFAGTHLNPNVTWFEQAGAFLQYLARCQYLLRQGQPVVDLCVYTGDRAYLHWDPKGKWCPKPTLTLPDGYTYDVVNTEALLERLTVKDGRLTLPDGMGYRMLVVDLEDETAPPAALRKIEELADAGATVVLGKRRPVRAPGLTDYPNCDREVQARAMALWGGREAQAVAKAGAGTLWRGQTLEAVLQKNNLAPDFSGPLSFTHRSDGETEIYFVAAKGSTGAADCTFRVSGKEPELWDPLTSQMRDAVCWEATAAGPTRVPLTLPENGSMFVIFRRPSEAHRLASTAGLGGATEIAGRTKNGFVLRTVSEDGPLAGPWEVRFAPGLGAPESATFERLIPWNEHPEAGIKYFSGTATYRKTFDLSESQAQGLVRLDLGKVANLAEVRVNGKSLGTLWTAPWRAELTGAVKPGRNELEIRVTNTWVNRLIGDAALPEEQRVTKTHARRPPGITGQYAHLKGYKADDPLRPAGLLGPVWLALGRQIEKGFPARP